MDETFHEPLKSHADVHLSHTLCSRGGKWLVSQIPYAQIAQN